MQPGLESVIMHVDDPSALDRLALGDSFQTVPAALNASAGLVSEIKRWIRGATAITALAFADHGICSRLFHK